MYYFSVSQFILTEYKLITSVKLLFVVSLMVTSEILF